jgi:6-phosphogluconolactonase
VTRTFQILPDPDAVAEAAADRFVAIARNAIRRRGVFRAALSGGATPRRVYPRIVVAPRVDAVDWSRAEFFFGDERTVPPDHPDSNYRCARPLLDGLPGLTPGCVHRMHGDADDLSAAAALYESELAHAFGLVSPSEAEDSAGADAAGADPARRSSPSPALDLVWLGMGRDGHTASLFPGSSALTERQRWVVATWAPGPACWRMTFTFPLINAARQAMIVAVGGDKAAPFQRIHRGSTDLPAGRVRARQTTWIVDAACAAGT